MSKKAMEYDRWNAGQIDGYFKNDRGGRYAAFAVGACNEFSDPNARYIVRFWTVNGDFDSTGVRYRWVPNLDEWSPTRVRSEYASLPVASESSFNNCLRYLTDHQAAVNQFTQQVTGGQDINATMWTGGKNPVPSSTAGNGSISVNGGYRADESGRYLAIGAIIILIAASLYILTR